jgi:hypothetical protein
VAQKVHKELPVFLERKANKAHKDQTDHEVLMENLVNLVLADLMDPKALAVSPVLTDHEEHLVQKDHQSTDVKAFPEHAVLLALQARMAMMVKTALLELLELMVLLVPEDQMALMESQDLKAERDRMVNPDHRASKARPVRTRRQTWFSSEALLRRSENNFLLINFN